VLERVLPLPAEAKVQNGQLKALLMPIARRRLPEAVWNRPKQGFGVPYSTRLSRTWGTALDAALTWGESHLDIFDYTYLRRLQKVNSSGGGTGMALWNPFVFLSWSMAHSLRL